MFWPSPSFLFFFSQGSLCWGKDEGFSTKQEDSCCAAEKCWSVSIFPAFQPLLNTLLKYRTVNVPVSLHTQGCSHPCDSSASLSLLTSSFCCRKVKKAKQKSKNKLYKLLLLLLQSYLSYPCVIFYSTFFPPSCHSKILINWIDCLFLSSRAWWRHQQWRDAPATAEEEGSGWSNCGECMWPQPLLGQWAHCYWLLLVVCVFFFVFFSIKFPQRPFMCHSALSQPKLFKN